MVLVKPGLKVPLIGPEATLLVPCRLTSFFGWKCAKKAPVEARVPELELPYRRQFRAVNPDPG